ncbi:MAG TPA: transcriptional regulator [Candidatus Dormibacteraeota bacterium]|nr:transcriptional regulator [Candidatus Dormibacteraeota bacterium]
MEQITWTAPGHLVALVRSQARRRGLSLDDYLTDALDRATRRDLSDEAERLRQRLDAARLLVSSGPPRRSPDPAEAGGARSSAGVGASLSDLLSLSRAG